MIIVECSSLLHGIVCGELRSFGAMGSYLKSNDPQKYIKRSKSPKVVFERQKSIAVDLGPKKSEKFVHDLHKNYRQKTLSEIIFIVNDWIWPPRSAYLIPNLFDLAPLRYLRVFLVDHGLFANIYRQYVYISASSW